MCARDDVGGSITRLLASAGELLDGIDHTSADLIGVFRGGIAKIFRRKRPRLAISEPIFGAEYIASPAPRAPPVTSPNRKLGRSSSCGYLLMVVAPASVGYTPLRGGRCSQQNRPSAATLVSGCERCVTAVDLWICRGPRSMPARRAPGPGPRANLAQLDARFDLAASLEVAEHLPQSSADRLVRFLTGLAPFVLFSAAVPFQRGHGPHKRADPAYWVELFGRCGFDVFDVIRPRCWYDRNVEFCHRQNVLLFRRHAQSGRSQPSSGRIAALTRRPASGCRAKPV